MVRFWGSVFVVSIVSFFSLTSCQRPMGMQSPEEHGASCVAMQPGVKQPIRTKFGALPASYTLSQEILPDGSLLYTAEVPVTFVPVQGLRNPSETVQQAWRDTSLCLQQVEPYLRGPKGEYLKIVLQDASRMGGASRRILVSDGPLLDGEGHSELWTTAWNCAKKFHEIEHLVGLVDTYLGHPNVYDCRPPGPLDAATTDPEAAFARVGLNGGIAPGMTRGTGPQNSLLYPAEFNAIVSPNCAISQKYATCTANAYRSSNRHGCQNVPQDCYNNPMSWFSSPSPL